MSGPLSIADIVARQKAEKEAASKPKFLGKKEREALALERRVAEIEAKRVVDDKTKQERDTFDKQAQEDSRARLGQAQFAGQGQHGRCESLVLVLWPSLTIYARPDDDNNGRGGYAGGYNSQGRGGFRGNAPPNGAPTGPRSQQGQQSQQSYQNGRGGYQGAQGQNSGRQGSYQSDPRANPMPPPSLPTPSPSASASSPAEFTSAAAIIPSAEMALIKSHYLGTDKHKRKARKMSDKKFEFDWAGEEDTSDSYNPIYATSVSVPLFGRGQIAGIDPKAQARNFVAGEATKSHE